MKFGKAFGAIAALQHKGVACGHACQLVFQTARFACENQWWIIGQRLFDFFKSGEVVIDRHLLGLFAAPAFRRPACGLFCIDGAERHTRSPAFFL